MALSNFARPYKLSTHKIVRENRPMASLSCSEACMGEGDVPVTID